MLKRARAELKRQAEIDPLWEPVEKACQVSLKFFFKRPKKDKKDGFPKRNAPRFVTKPPDLDNLGKLVLDALQPCVLGNDKYT